VEGEAVTEAEWLAATDPGTMLAYLRTYGNASDRKLRLFAVACIREKRSFLTNILSHEAVEAAERFADGSINRRELEIAGSRAHGVFSTRVAQVAKRLARARLGETPEQAASLVKSTTAVWLLRDVFGNPFRRHDMCRQSTMALHGGSVSHLAEAVYADRAFDRLPLIADALEDAGCTDADLLGHLRSPEPHVRGCWAVDLVLGKS
jgi:hypothetical protein